MNYDIISSGVGGQGVLSISAIIAGCGLKEGLHVKQSEEHGMAQRGGAVVTHLRLSDRAIHSDLVPRGSAHMVLSLEPMESLRHIAFLRPDGVVISAVDPIQNIPNYPDLERVLGTLRGIPRTRLIEAGRLAREAGSARAVNMVMVGAASDLLPLRPETIEQHVREVFAPKGDAVVETNLKALRGGREAARCVAAVGS